MTPALIFGLSALVGLGISVGLLISVIGDLRLVKAQGTNGVLRILLITDLGNEATRAITQAIMVAVTIVSLSIPRVGPPPPPRTGAGAFVTWGLVAVSVLTLLASLHAWRGRRKATR